VSRQVDAVVEWCLAVRDESDVAMVRKRTREVGRDSGLRPAAVEALTTAVSEVTRNIVVHGGGGEAVIRVGEVDQRSALVIIAHDQGPGIADLDRAMEDGYSTGGGLGIGLPSARRLTDRFEIVSAPAQGTTVTLTMWIDSMNVKESR
jgi:serine/threonine-protein kinase RsbT